MLKSGEGAYVADAATLSGLEARGQVLARYVGASPNGSAAGIAGICSESGSIAGLMPHPEHAIDPLTGPGDDGLGFFTSAVRALVTEPGRVTPDEERVRRARGTTRARREHDGGRAAATPDRPQPYAELGLTGEEYLRIIEVLGRRPTDAELAIYSVMWSEHCSYKSSRAHLRQFADKAPPTTALLAGMGQNAGVVDIGQGYAVTFKLESHNHPSYVEPFQGAATGVGGIVRDILAMGARPVAVMDSLRFGPADAPDTRRVLPGVVAGISFYGNCLGLPNIGGELAFDACYAGNPLVNALCLGVMRHEDLKLAAATGPGNKVVLLGSRTGPDGIGGASVLASASFQGGGAGAEGAKRPSVQVGDPFMEKLLVECCLELYAAGLVVGVQDLGAAGVACATTELAAGGGAGVGMRVRLDSVPLRDASLGPAEILMSESQERMMAIVEPAGLERFLAICAKWDVQATVIGDVTDTGRLEMTWHGDLVVDIPPGSAADQGPVYLRPSARPAWPGGAAG